MLSDRVVVLSALPDGEGRHPDRFCRGRATRRVARRSRSSASTSRASGNCSDDAWRTRGRDRGADLARRCFGSSSSRRSALDPGLFPPPVGDRGELLAYAISGELATNSAWTLRTDRRSGVLIGGIPGTLVGLAMGMNRWVRAVLRAGDRAALSDPEDRDLAAAVLHLRYGEAAKWAAVAIGVFFLMAINTEAGVRQIEPIFLDVARAYRIRPASFYFRVLLPGALPKSTPASSSASASRSCWRSHRSFNSPRGPRLRTFQRAAIARRRPAIRRPRRGLAGRRRADLWGRPHRTVGDPVAARPPLSEARVNLRRRRPRNRLEPSRLSKIPARRRAASESRSRRRTRRSSRSRSIPES